MAIYIKNLSLIVFYQNSLNIAPTRTYLGLQGTSKFFFNGGKMVKYSYLWFHGKMDALILIALIFLLFVNKNKSNVSLFTSGRNFYMNAFKKTYVRQTGIMGLLNKIPIEKPLIFNLEKLLFVFNLYHFSAVCLLALQFGFKKNFLT